MKYTIVFAFFTFFASALSALAQDSPLGGLILAPVPSPEQSMYYSSPNSEITGVQKTGDRSGFVHTGSALFRTVDNGATWNEIRLPEMPNAGAANAISLADTLFDSPEAGLVLLASTNGLSLARTLDGGNSWTTDRLMFEGASALEAIFESAQLSRVGSVLRVTLRIPTSSNFDGRIVYRSEDAGSTWTFEGRLVEKASAVQVPQALASGTWNVSMEGRCAGFKTGCVQQSTLLIAGEDKTPQRIRELAASASRDARAQVSQTPLFAVPPGGTTRISLNRGFDKCLAGSISQMQLWWDNSPYFNSNIYISGRNRGCPTQPLSTAWVDQVTAMGWGLIPTVVGYQSPCTSSTTTVKLSYDPAVSESQGRLDADIAVTDAANIGLTAGSIIYYDMERYDPPSPDTLGCRAATVAFLKGWTDRIKELGYISGVYGSPKNAQEDWQFMPPASRMDAVWLARWDNIMSVWTYASFPTFPSDVWSNHQRIKQWQAPHNETWGGVTFNIDGDIADAPVAGNVIPKNTNADFDGDGKTDISVYRPEGGLWYVLNSRTSSLTVTAFGSPTDIIAPSDYDGDGKTDYAIFRPSQGVWFTMGKAGVVTSRQFGADGDIPVAADYNGDGKADIAVFRPSNGVWYIANSDSRGTYTFVNFGLTGDKPVQADYDADGKTDIAVWRPSSGDWYVLYSSTGGFTGYRFGQTGDKPAQGDFDGDEKADYVIYRDGNWYVLQTTAGLAVYQFGAVGDVPVTGDYDGDGRADVSVYRPSNGVWFLLQSTAGFGGTTFGTGEDRAVPSGYLAP